MNIDECRQAASGTMYHWQLTELQDDFVFLTIYSITNLEPIEPNRYKVMRSSDYISAALL